MGMQLRPVVSLSPILKSSRSLLQIFRLQLDRMSEYREGVMSADAFRHPVSARARTGSRRTRLASDAGPASGSFLSTRLTPFWRSLT
jgi:hypothetical protein